jgi:antitoxin PrlF
MVVATLTSKGQMTLPKAIRERLGLKPGDQVELTPTEDGRVVMSPRRRLSVRDLFGMLPSHGVSVSIDEMDEAIASHAVERFERSRQ